MTAQLHPAGVMGKTITIGNTSFGLGRACQLIAGPCTVDKHIDELVRHLAAMGITHVRGGCWKPRSEANSFPGFGAKAVYWLLTAAKKYHVECVYLEVMDITHIQVVRQARQEIGYEGEIVLWVGARTGNQSLLRELGSQDEFPVMLKNGLTGGIKELKNRLGYVELGNQEYDDDATVICGPSIRNNRLMICLRGVESTDPKWRFLPNHNWIPQLRMTNTCPDIVDPSHAAGKGGPSLVLENTTNALPHMPDGFLVEVYFDKDSGPKGCYPLCDADQAVPLSMLPTFQTLIAEHNRRHNLA